MIKLFWDKGKGCTIYRYFFSYIVIFTVLIVGFFIIMRGQLTRRYYEQLSAKAEEQLTHLITQLEEDILYLSQIDNSMAENITLIMSRYKNESWNNYDVLSEIKKYDVANKSIGGIVYKADDSDAVLTTQASVIYKEGIFQFYREGMPGLTFNTSCYLNSLQNQIILLADEYSQYLIYLPKERKDAGYIMFYTLDLFEICRSMENVISDEIPAIAFITSDNRIITGVNKQLLTPYVDEIKLEEGIIELEKSYSLCVETGINNEFYMVSLISNTSLIQQLNEVFASSYLMLLILAIVGFLLVLLAMRMTYFPLHKLIKKNIPDLQENVGYIEQMDVYLSELDEHRKALEDKLDKYRLSIQKSLLDSIIFSEGIEEIPNVNLFFESDSNNEIFVIRLKLQNDSIPYQDIHEYLQNCLSGKSFCAVLERKNDIVVLLVNCVEMEGNKQDILKEILCDICKKYGCVSAISNSSNSIMDIPLLYKNAEIASKYWNEINVSDYTLLTPIQTNFNFPHEQLSLWSKTLEEQDIFVARETLSELFRIMDATLFPENVMSNFFVQCILMNMLTILIKAMSRIDIKFNVYSDIYFETLYFCRSHSYFEKRENIVENTQKLLELYEKELSDRRVKAEQIRSVIEELYTDPDFSITTMAERFHVSMTHMSYLVKKELNENFSDYLWQMRMSRAKTLLKESELSIDEISAAVGYLNTSSFRRKFKQDMGVTPSQYRTEVGK